jgi:hypothetical protein
MSFERIRTALFEPAQTYQALTAIWRAVKPWVASGHRLHLEIRADTRSLAQNRRMWAMLTELSQQVTWHGMKLSPDDFKVMLTAARKQQRAVPAIDGKGFVVLGEQTSQMTVAEMSELIELITAFGTEHGVLFRDLEALEHA